MFCGVRYSTVQFQGCISWQIHHCVPISFMKYTNDTNDLPSGGLLLWLCGLRTLLCDVPDVAGFISVLVLQVICFLRVSHQTIHSETCCFQRKCCCFFGLRI